MMSSSAPVRLAILGSGAIAQTHAQAISLLPEARLVAVCSRNPSHAIELAAPANAAVFDSVEKLVASSEIDAVLIATPSGVHEETARPALRAGKHVLCEKPLEISTERITRMVRDAEQSGVILAGFFPLRCGAGAQAIHQAVEAGRFGRLTMISARIKWWRGQEYYRASNWRGTRELDGGGALMNQGIHAVDLMQWLGGPVAEAMALADSLAHPGLEVEDTLVSSLRFKNGAMGTIAAATSCYPGLDISLEISGDQGTAILINDRIEFWQFAEEDPNDNDVRENRKSCNIGGGTSDPRAISCEGHRQQIAGFCRAIRGDASEIIDGREAGRAVALVEAIYRSVSSGKSEHLFTP